jgi:hypothetical protein
MKESYSQIKNSIEVCQVGRLIPAKEFHVQLKFTLGKFW